MPNAVRMQREKLEKGHLMKYKARRRQFYLWSAAAQIWARGVPRQDALGMITTAFDATTFEE